MPFDLGMEVSNITNKQRYGEEWCFRESEKAKVLNKALGNIQDKKGKIMPEYKLRKADRPNRTKW